MSGSICQNPDVVTIGGRFGWALTRTLATQHPDWVFFFVMRDSAKVGEAAATRQVKAFFNKKIRAAKIEKADRPDLEKMIQMPGNVSFCSLDDFNRNFRGRVKQLFIPAVPSNRIRRLLIQMIEAGVPKKAFASCEVLSVSKGMETASMEFPHEIMDHVLGGDSVVALGGNLAFEFALGDPMLMEFSGYRNNTRRISRFFKGSNLIIYETYNRRKLSLAGPMKNIHSLATGMTSEIFGNSGVSTIATMGLSEFERAAFIIQFRKKYQPLARQLQKLPFHFRSVPIAGGAMSDYHLFRSTRNFDAGQAFVKEIKKGKNAEQAMAIISQKATIESFASALPTREFLRRMGCRSPVIEMMADILTGKVCPETGIRRIIRQENLIPT